jgi:hypothetical protein
MKFHGNRISIIALAWMIVTTAMKGQVFLGEGNVASVQVKTNTLYDAALCPNIGTEIQTDLGIAWQIDYIGAWWNSDAKHRYWSNYALQTEIRYYFNHTSMDAPFSRHHLGLYAQLATYDFEFGGTGYMCRDLDKSFGFGTSYGYSLPVGERWNLDFTFGIGYFESKYEVYEPYINDYRRTDRRRLTFFGPTKLEVSLVWNLNKQNRMRNNVQSYKSYIP